MGGQVLGLPSPNPSSALSRKPKRCVLVEGGINGWPIILKCRALNARVFIHSGREEF